MYRVPCEFKEWKDKNGVKIGYKVTIYYVVCESERSIPFDLHSFTCQSDALDNALMARDCGIFAEVQRCYIHVSPTFYPSIYNAIEEYVSQPKTDRE